MRKIVLKTMMMLVASLIPLAHASAGTVTYTARYDSDQWSIGTKTLGGVTYTTVKYHGLYNTGAPGEPSLPVQYLMFSVPCNAVNFKVSATPTVGEVCQISHPVMPNRTLDSNISIPDSAIYNSANPYPSNMACVAGEKLLAGENHVVIIAVAPVILEHTSGYRLSLMETISLTLSYELSGTPNLHPLVRDGRAMREKGFEYTCGMVANPQDVEDNAVQVPSIRLRDNNGYLIPDENVTDPATYLIITTQNEWHAMQRLAAIKRQKGITVKVVTLDEVLNDPRVACGDSVPTGDDDYIIAFNDNAGKIRQYLRLHYLHNATEYVLLAGSNIPHRDASDMYYSGLDCDWIIWKDDSHELNVGSLAGRGENRMNNYVDKLFRYELNPGNGDYSYLKRALYLEGSNYPLEAEDRYSDNLQSMLPYEKYFTNEGDLEFNGADIIDTICVNHYGFIGSFNDGRHHSLEIYKDYDLNVKHYLWATDSVKTVGDIVDMETGNGLNCMLNKEYPMIFCSGAGWTMSFGAVQGYGDVSLGESFTMGKDYGGPVYMGFTADPFGLSTDYIIGEFASNLSSSGYQPCVAQAGAKILYFGSNGEDEIAKWNYLGDPALEMWSDMPQAYSGITVSRSDNGITVSGITAANTVVAYHSNDGTTGQQTASASSVTLNNVSPNSTVMLYRHNYIPYIAPLVLQNTTLGHSQYVIASEVSAGRAVDSNRTRGDVTVSDGVECEIEATGDVTLAGGFEVELGATFAVRPASFK